MKMVNDFVAVCPASVSDERLVFDALVPGFGKDDIIVRTAKVDGGDTFVIKVKGTYKRRTNKDGAVIPRLSFEKKVADFKFEISGTDGSFVGDKLFCGDYKIDEVKYSVENGVLRISIDKTAAAVGEVVKASANVDANSAGETPTTEPVADAD